MNTKQDLKSLKKYSRSLIRYRKFIYASIAIN